MCDIARRALLLPLPLQIWEFLEQNYPEMLGPVNPYNANITALFGNQGGYGN
jgi:hypothetical protein